MNPETPFVADLLTPWEAWGQPLLWYIVPNLLLNLMTAFWLAGQLASRRRLGEKVAVWRWTLFSALIGIIWPAITGPLAWRAAEEARRRGHRAAFWTGLIALTSFPGYVAFRVFDDADSRGMRAPLWAAAAGVWYAVLCFGLPISAAISPVFRSAVFAPARLLLTIPASLGLLAVFPALYTALRRRLDFDDVRRRWRDPAAPPDVLVRVENLRTWFPVRRGVFSAVRGYVRAVDGVSFEVRRGEVLGLVGESGCGKTTVGRTILGLVPLTAGRVLVDGVDLSRLNAAEWRAVRRKICLLYTSPSPRDS